MTRGFVRAFLGVLVVAAVGTLWWYAGRPTGEEPLAIAAVRGDVVRYRDEQASPGRVGMSLAPGDRLVTGADGSATLSRGGGSDLEIAPGSTVALSRVEDGMVDVVIEQGRVRARVRPDGGAVRIAANGRSVLATDATVAVALDEGEVGVEVERGSVAVAGVPNVSGLDAGERLHVFADGDAVVRPVSADLLLEVAWPEPVATATVRVAGTTEPGASVRVIEPTSSEASVRADRDGRFELELTLPSGRTDVVVAVRDTFGRERTARGVLQRRPASEGPGFRLELDYGRR